MSSDIERLSPHVAAAQETAGLPIVSRVGDFDDDSDITQTKDIPEHISSYPGAFSDFYGLPSCPISVYRTGDEWPVPKGPQAQRVPREARPVCNHPIQDVWTALGTQVYQFLDSNKIFWSTIDLVRFAEKEGEAGPLYLWVGVNPGSLSLEDAKAAAVGCKKILAQFPDIEIAFRESVYTRSAQLLKYDSFDPIADISSPFTGVLGVQIAPKNTPYEGTGALYLCEGGQSNRVFLLTARHVALPPKHYSTNELYQYDDSQPSQEILILGNEAYSDARKYMCTEIEKEEILCDILQRKLAALEKNETKNTTQVEACQVHQVNLRNTKSTITATRKFHSDIDKDWGEEDQRVLGRVVYAPPISGVSVDPPISAAPVDPSTPTALVDPPISAVPVDLPSSAAPVDPPISAVPGDPPISAVPGPKHYVEDWALIEIDRNKVDWNNFKGNVVYLGPTSESSGFTHKMGGRSSFKYPLDSLLQLKGVVQKGEIRQPKELGPDKEECLLVIKNGRKTRTTIGRGSGLESFVREYDDNGNIKSTSMEIAIYPYNYKSGAFSAPGDSGSIVADGLGRIVGLLTGGSGKAEDTDVTYVTPYFWIEEQIKKAFPDSYLYPSQGVD
ncbi:hypothetical protein K435DRAFT_762286 [Dendrothele bispora CBS 962.96]|uniref:Peptidase S1 domain-containing protein n=1 Tax=Dendrothele bispora (strain CBS 962.96) TaxID=1314807 RepID=A0A4V4HDN8_DENBC|nr:hypothetical protein K435DRAFT_762286 [Dendrothele bispora CBS 962.96]